MRLLCHHFEERGQGHTEAARPALTACAGRAGISQRHLAASYRGRARPRSHWRRAHIAGLLSQAPCSLSPRGSRGDVQGSCCMQAATRYEGNGVFMQALPLPRELPPPLPLSLPLLSHSHSHGSCCMQAATRYEGNGVILAQRRRTCSHGTALTRTHCSQHAEAVGLDRARSTLCTL
jgi:hypothetical protein